MEPNRVFIAVMGVTGAGKSTFIRTASQLDEVAIGHDFKSCTASVNSYRFQHEDLEITLIDTPGFNDTTRGETEVLREIADWLDITYRNPPRIKLSGIVYMQALDDRRIYGSTLRNLKMFRQLCGDEPLKNVIFTTTGWGLAGKSDQLGRAVDKEAQLCSDPLFWEPMIRRGAQTARFEDSRQSALELIKRLVPKPPVILQIQHELVDESKNLIDTSAGSTVNEEIKKLEAKYKAQLEAVQAEMQHALDQQDLELADALRENAEHLQHLKDEARRAQDILKYETRNIERRYDNEMRDLRVALEDTRAAAEAEKERIQAEAAAQRYEDNLRFEAIVAQLRENMTRVREEDRTVLEEQIQSAEKERNKQGRGKKLLLGLLPLVGNVVLSALGFGMLGGAL